MPVSDWCLQDPCSLSVLTGQQEQNAEKYAEDRYQQQKWFMFPATIVERFRKLGISAEDVAFLQENKAPDYPDAPGRLLHCFLFTDRRNPLKEWEGDPAGLEDASLKDVQQYGLEGHYSTKQDLIQLYADNLTSDGLISFSQYQKWIDLLDSYSKCVVIRCPGPVYKRLGPHFKDGLMKAVGLTPQNVRDALRLHAIVHDTIVKDVAAQSLYNLKTNHFDGPLMPSLYRTPRALYDSFVGMYNRLYRDYGNLPKATVRDEPRRFSNLGIYHTMSKPFDLGVIFRKGVACHNKFFTYALHDFMEVIEKRWDRNADEAKLELYYYKATRSFKFKSMFDQLPVYDLIETVESRNVFVNANVFLEELAEYLADARKPADYAAYEEAAKAFRSGPHVPGRPLQVYCLWDDSVCEVPPAAVKHLKQLTVLLEDVEDDDALIPIKSDAATFRTICRLCTDKDLEVFKFWAKWSARNGYDDVEQSILARRPLYNLLIVADYLDCQKVLKPAVEAYVEMVLTTPLAAVTSEIKAITEDSYSVVMDDPLGQDIQRRLMHSIRTEFTPHGPQPKPTEETEA